MPRCCVPDCDSGTFKEVKRTKAAGLRLKSYFTFPKDKDLLRKWKEVIFHNQDKITDKLTICDLHFHESDIQKHYETKLKDGTIHRISRGKYTLQKGAIPISREEEESIPINNIQERDSTNNTSEIIVPENQLISLIYDKNNSELLKQEESLSVNKYRTIIQQTTSNSSNFKTYIPNNLQCKEKVNIQMKVYTGNNQRHKTVPSGNQLFVPNIQKKEIVTETENNNSMSTNEDTYTLRKSFKHDTSEDHYKTDTDESEIHIQAVNEKLISNKENYDKMNDRVQDYNFRCLENDLQAKRLNISSSWAYAFQENASITFAYVHPLKQAIQLLCIVDSNMNIKITTYDKRVTIDVNVKFDSSTDFTNYLCKLEKKKCCDGTGVKNKYSEKCQGFISSDEEYKRSRGYHRCNPCREFRKIILKRENDSIDVNLRIREQNRKIKLLQYKYKQLQKLLSKHQKVGLMRSAHNLLKNE